jgi:hypothetical protein
MENLVIIRTHLNVIGGAKIAQKNEDTRIAKFFHPSPKTIAFSFSTKSKNVFFVFTRGWPWFLFSEAIINGLTLSYFVV